MVLAVLCCIDYGKACRRKVGKQFNSFGELEACLIRLSEKFCYPFRVFNSQMVPEAIQRRLKAKTPTQPIDEKWKYTYYSVKCVQFGEARHRGKGIRPKQQHCAKALSLGILLSSYTGRCQ